MKKLEVKHKLAINKRYDCELRFALEKLLNTCISITNSTNYAKENKFKRITFFRNGNQAQAIYFISKCLARSITEELKPVFFCADGFTDEEADTLYITDTEFLTIYNHVVSNKKITSSELYRGDDAYEDEIIRYLDNTIPSDLESMCNFISRNLHHTADKRYIQVDASISIDTDKNEAALYILYFNESPRARSKHAKKLKELFSLPDPSIYEIDRGWLDYLNKNDTIVHQYDISLDQLYSIYAYIKLLNSTDNKEKLEVLY